MSTVRIVKIEGKVPRYRAAAPYEAEAIEHLVPDIAPRGIVSLTFSVQPTNLADVVSFAPEVNLPLADDDLFLVIQDGIVKNIDAIDLPSGGGGTNVITSVYTSNATPFALPSTNSVLYLIRQDAPAALVVNLPASPATNLQVGIKDSGNGFTTYHCTVKTTDGTQIDGVAGATGIVMNADRQQLWFIYDGSMWNIL